MGALAPISCWFREDDLLLKNAVEDGASLESLAKGAVNFSRRYTIRELQDRWNSLLYDPDTSAEASTHMVELERSTSYLSLKVNKFGFSKENEWVPGKRKDGSVRSHYYTMRKRICTEPCSSIDLSFLVAPSFQNYIGNEEGCPEQLTHLNEHSVGNCMLGDPIGHHFELGDTNFDMVCHDFPQIVNADTAEGNIGGHSFHSGHMDSFQGGLPNGLMARNCLYGFAENVSPVSVNEAVGIDDVGHSFEHNNGHKDIPHILGESMSVFNNNLDIQEIGTPQELPVGDLFETADLKSKLLCTFDSIHNNSETVCSDFGGNQDFSSPVSDCGASFDQLGYSSQLPVMPIWRTDEDISVPTMPMDENLGSKVEDTVVDTLPAPDDAKKISPSGYDNVHSEISMTERQCGDGLNSSTALPEGLEGDFHLMTLMHVEGFLFMDDGKDGMDRSSPDRRCLDGFLLSSPNDVHHHDISGVSNIKTPLALDTNFLFSDVEHADAIGDPLHAGDKVCDSEINLPAFRSVPNPHSPERVNGVICCVLNTEDPEIPCNDDIFFSTPVLPSFVSSAIEHKFETMEFSDPTVKKFTDKTKASKQVLNIVNEEGETSGLSLIASRKTESRVLPDICPNHSINDGGVKELPESESLPLAAWHANNTAGGAPSQCGSVPVAPLPIPAGGLEKQFSNAELGKHTDFNNSLDFLIERPFRASDHIMNQPENIIDGCKHEANGPDTIQMQASTHAAPGSLEMDFPEPFMNPSISDQEEHLSENEDDIPYFSDIEAMVLDMDLGLCDLDSRSSREVYKYEDTKRAIIRLEQGAESHMQRAMASHRAFAVLYGRYSKHYIKKPKVSLGRAVGDAHVDINLGKDGCSKAISRQQAIIKMDEDGSFSFMNLGQHPVLVNSKEVAKGQRHMLSSRCMIEIRGMRYLFEVNQNYVRQYLDKKSEKES